MRSGRPPLTPDIPQEVGQEETEVQAVEAKVPGRTDDRRPGGGGGQTHSHSKEAFFKVIHSAL